MTSGLILPPTQNESVLACFAPFIQNYFMGASSQVLNLDLDLKSVPAFPKIAWFPGLVYTPIPSCSPV